ncbi:MAG: 23S rRNA (cytosine1962-C5)-methyltransferase [Myxococcota bacterium]|jgi:23S rRNA (cytosine1962-C5)-methyltransferase
MPEDYRKGGKNAQRRRGGSKKRHRGGLPFQPSAGDAVVVNGYSERWLRSGFPWVYQNEVIGRTGALVPGRVVTICSREGKELGVGIWDEGHIEVRRFRRDKGPLNADLLRDRIQQARARRALPPDTNAWRLIHGENDDLPGVRVEVWDTVAVISLDSPSLHGLVDPLVEVLTSELELSAVWLHWRGKDPRFDKLQSGLIWGPQGEPEIQVQECGIQFLVDPAAGHDIGLFCDMRPMRQWMAPHWAGRRVLNTFCFTGAFSVAAALGGAVEVISVDLSQPYLDRAKANFTANSLDPDSHTFWAEDTFRALDRLRRKGEQFDVVIADPPSFSHGPAGTWSVSKDYKRLVSACLRVLAPGGWLIAATNLGTISPKEFKGYLINGAEKAGRELRVLHESCPPTDFPAALTFPESRYLKCWVLQA